VGPGESSANFTKHGVRFADAVTALEDDLALTIRDLSLEGEERWVTMGLDTSADSWWWSIPGALSECD
jgi:uncharacterized DUF497 family protein